MASRPRKQPAATQVGLSFAGGPAPVAAAPAAPIVPKAYSATVGCIAVDTGTCDLQLTVNENGFHFVAVHLTLAEAQTLARHLAIAIAALGGK